MHICITGGSFGLGEALAKTFSSNGHSVTVIDKEKNRTLKCTFIKHNFKHAFRERIVCDVLIVNHATFGGFAPFHAHSAEYVNEYLKTNLSSYLDLILLSTYRRLVFINSVLSMAAFPNASLYCACKSFMKAFLESLQREGKNILIVYPFKINTSLFSEVKDTYTLDRYTVAREVYTASLAQSTSLYIPWIFRLSPLLSLLPSPLQNFLIRMTYACLVRKKERGDRT
ncbi:hypothetical protein NECID01_1829 [Nematocida sp. AWRm77]|nr:hypothetical protein NECID01_1829 [Nematocida sp. AWRm77]